MADVPLLSVRGLTIRSRTSPGAPPIVGGISFDVIAERLALVGESGSGKSLTARALLGLLPASLQAAAERLDFQGTDLRALTPSAWGRIRGGAIALVLQDARHALNPVLSVRRQLDEALVLHQRLAPAERRERIDAMLETVGLTDIQRIGAAYPHELSGGMGQRVMLAMMLINGPRLLIADEPTSALDAIVRDQVLELMSALVDQRRMGLLLISHDLQQVARHCERALVIYRGRIVDEQPAARLASAVHPYTRTLWSCRPSARTYGTRLPVLERDANGVIVGAP